ncbi:hypothetical protein [uncultured Campylobacter sp.]|uniref:hypothetical protein n=1 Tax=uncultured Campylobacter sp. TaxID=218934 RepID=UPI002608EDF5|nr:hypothetical protein [uncultured Campylobacter sp.]
MSPFGLNFNVFLSDGAAAVNFKIPPLSAEILRLLLALARRVKFIQTLDLLFGSV